MKFYFIFHFTVLVCGTGVRTHVPKVNCVVLVVVLVYKNTVLGCKHSTDADC